MKVLESPRIEKIPLRNREFSQKLREQVRNLSRCYQCSMCSDGCPVAYAMDYHPNQIIHMVQLGLKEKVLQSTAIWLCVSCDTCGTRCPNEIDIVRLMDVLCNEALREGVKSPATKILKFHQTFVEEIKKRGRVNEIRLWLNYELKTGEFLSLKKFLKEAGIGLKMFRKGKLKLTSQKMHQPREVKEIFKKVLGGKRRMGRG